MKDGLVDIAESNSKRCEGVQDLIGYPARMAYLDDQRVIFESRLQLPKIPSILWLILEGPGKLDQDCAQAVRLHNWGKARLEVALVVWRGLSFVREQMEKLGRKTKVSIVADTVNPLLRRSWSGRTVIGGVDLNGAEITGNIRKRIEIPRRGLWIDDSFPVLVLPPRRSDSNHNRPT
jgi:hypothetical protein